MTKRQSGNPVVLNTMEVGTPDSPAVVVLHGLFGSSTNWRSITKELANDFHVIAADMRNHGESPWSDTMRYGDMAADVALLIDQFRLERPSIIGHSMGGKSAMALAQMDLAQIDKLIVADIAPIAYGHSHEDYVNAMRDIDLQRVSSRREVDELLANSIPEPGIRQFLLQNLIREKEGYSWRINLEAIQNNMQSLLDYSLDQVSETETLFIAGEHSNYISAESNESIVRLFPDSRIETIENAGHWLHAEQPARFVETVKSFLLASSA